MSGGRKCAKNAVCQNVVGSYQCNCPAGYEGDGVHCCLSLKHIQLLQDQGFILASELMSVC